MKKIKSLLILGSVFVLAACGNSMSDSEATARATEIVKHQKEKDVTIEEGTSFTLKGSIEEVGKGTYPANAKENYDSSTKIDVEVSYNAKDNVYASKLEMTEIENNEKEVEFVYTTYSVDKKDDKDVILVTMSDGTNKQYGYINVEGNANSFVLNQALSDLSSAGDDYYSLSGQEILEKIILANTTNEVVSGLEGTTFKYSSAGEGNLVVEAEMNDASVELDGSKVSSKGKAKMVWDRYYFTSYVMDLDMECTYPTNELLGNKSGANIKETISLKYNLSFSSSAKVPALSGYTLAE